MTNGNYQSVLSQGLLVNDLAGDFVSVLSHGLLISDTTPPEPGGPPVTIDLTAIDSRPRRFDAFDTRRIALQAIDSRTREMVAR